MPNETKERIVALDVGELSMVDSPAIEEEFAVLKRSNMEDEMPKEIDEVTKTEPQTEEAAKNDENASTDDKEVEKVNVEASEEESTDAKLLKRMDEVKELVKGLNGKEEEVEKSEDDKKEETKPTEKNEEEVKTEKNDEAEADVEKNAKEEEKVEKNKPADSVEEVEKTLDVLVQSLTKAKRFTPGRIDKIKSAIEQLAKVMEEVAGGAKTKELPKDVSISDSKLISVTKKIEETLTLVNDKIGEMDDRVSEIEKTRNPSTSIEDEGSTDGKTDVQKNNKFWNGVL